MRTLVYLGIFLMALASVAECQSVSKRCPKHANHICTVTATNFAAPGAQDWKKFEEAFKAAADMTKLRGETWNLAYLAQPIAGTFRLNGPKPFNYCGEGGKGVRSDMLGVFTSITYYPPGVTPPPTDPEPKDTGQPPPPATICWTNVVNGSQFDPDPFRIEYPADGYDPQHPDWFGDTPCHPCIEFWEDRFMTVAFTKTVVDKTTTYSFDKQHAWTWGYRITCVPIPEPATLFLFASGLVGVSGVLRRRRR